VVGVDFSEVAVRGAQRRAGDLGVTCRYVVGTVPGVPLASASADLVYPGKGALIWMPDLTAWAREVARLLRPSGHLIIYEAHPAVPLWTWDQDEPRVRPDRSYFDRSHVNDTFPARGAVEWQWTLGEIVTAVIAADMELLLLTDLFRSLFCLAAFPGERGCGVLGILPGRVPLGGHLSSMTLGGLCPLHGSF
jgi:SAM-dependent methyltransferase